MNSMAHNPHVSPHTKFKDAPILYPGNNPPPSVPILGTPPGFLSTRPRSACFRLSVYVPPQFIKLLHHPYLVSIVLSCPPPVHQASLPPKDMRPCPHTIIKAAPQIISWLHPPGSLFSLFPAPSHMGRVSCRSLLTRAPWRGWQP